MSKFNYEQALKKASRGYEVWIQPKKEDGTPDYNKKGYYKTQPDAFKFVVPYRKRLGIFKTSTGKVYFDPNTFAGFSYNWQCVAKINGKVIFNNYQYSNTTTQHQWTLKSLLKQLGIKIDAYTDTRESLTYAGASSLLQSYYRNIFRLELEEKRANAKSRRYLINANHKSIKKLNEAGFKVSQKQIADWKKYETDIENRRLQGMKEVRDRRKALRDRLKAIVKTPVEQLNAKDMLTETNVEVRKALINRIGAAKVLVQLNAEVLDKAHNYELVNLKLQENDRPRPYLRMINPSTGEVHVEGVHPRCNTVNEALAWRNQQPTTGEFIKPIKLT